MHLAILNVLNVCDIVFFLTRRAISNGFGVGPPQSQRFTKDE